MNVICGNNIDILKKYPDNYFDAIVTDPPYGLSKEPNAELLMKDWIEKGYHEITGTGFMGKEWDSFIPQPIFWKEVFRVLKHGGHVLSFFGTRTYDWGVMSMRFAGFEVRDCIQWLYGSGFPKSHNISKAIDKMYGAEREVVGESAYTNMNIKGKDGFMVNDTEKRIRQQITEPSTDQAKEWNGWGSALKPANEPIVLARKPLEKGLTIAENVLKWGTGAINIDGCRVGIENRTYKGMSSNKPDVGTFRDDNWQPKDIKVNVNGRFPANLILTHHPDCECKGLKKVKPSNGSGKASENGGGFNKGMFGDGTSDNIGGGFTDENGEETIEDWNCVDDCPIKILDEQSGVLKSGAMNSIAKGGKYNVYGTMTERIVTNEASEGGASRFFYVAKASKSERNKGLDEFYEKKPQHDFGTDFGESRETRTHTNTKNFHPTVKPIKLMQYLVRLITPKNGIVLDPFCGSGTTGVACKLEGFEFLGLEQDEEYSKIAAARIDTFVEETIVLKNLVKKEIINNQINLKFEFD
jgi:site-specific DNA-methyltransferase (adenine-specific)